MLRAGLAQVAAGAIFTTVWMPVPPVTDSALVAAVAVGDGTVVSVGVGVGVSLGVAGGVVVVAPVGVELGVACWFGLLEQEAFGDGWGEPSWVLGGRMAAGVDCPDRVGTWPPLPEVPALLLAGALLGKSSRTSLARIWVRPNTPATTMTTAPTTARTGRPCPVHGTAAP